MSPPFSPHAKHLNAPFSTRTLKLGSVSLWKGHIADRHSPLPIRFNPFFSKFKSGIQLTQIVFDLFNDSLNTAISEFVEYFILFFSFVSRSGRRGLLIWLRT
jgi:hypothetical protein